jgi:hypothetical protein
MVWHESCFIHDQENPLGFWLCRLCDICTIQGIAGRFVGRAGGNVPPPPTACGKSLPPDNDSYLGQ